MPFLILFVVMPIAEMWLLIEVGGRIGALPTIALVLLTAMVGLALLRVQGISTLNRLQRKAQAGEMPLQEMVEGIFLAVGGALLLTPGFITDAIGFSCLLPGIRHILIGQLFRRFIASGRMQGNFQAHYQNRQDGQDGDEIIDGEFIRHPNDGDDDDPRHLK